MRIECTDKQNTLKEVVTIKKKITLDELKETIYYNYSTPQYINLPNTDRLIEITGNKYEINNLMELFVPVIQEQLQDVPVEDIMPGTQEWSEFKTMIYLPDIGMITLIESQEETVKALAKRTRVKK